MCAISTSDLWTLQDRHHWTAWFGRSLRLVDAPEGRLNEIPADITGHLRTTVSQRPCDR
jgi:hypothetical protein